MNRSAQAADGNPDARPVEFKAIRSARAFEEIAAQIREELVQGRLRVGSRLPPERALSEQFGVSRNTLREALRSLEHAGLIRLQKGATGGAFISARTGDAVMAGLRDMFHVGAVRPEELTQARIWLESIIVREACKRATPQDIEELQRNIKEAEDAVGQGDFAARVEKRIEFHRILARMTGNPIMVTVMNGVLDVLADFVQRLGDHENAFVLPSRRRFMKYFVAGDAEKAVVEMEASLKRLQRSYLSRLNGEARQDGQPAASGRAADKQAAVRRRAAAATKPAR